MHLPYKKNFPTFVTYFHQYYPNNLISSQIHYALFCHFPKLFQFFPSFPKFGQSNEIFPYAFLETSQLIPKKLFWKDQKICFCDYLIFQKEAFKNLFFQICNQNFNKTHKKIIYILIKLMLLQLFPNHSLKHFIKKSHKHYFPNLPKHVPTFSPIFPK